MTTVESLPETGELIYVQLEDLEPNPANVRTSYDRAAIKELATSIKERGLLQPIRVTDNRVEGSTKPFMLVSGHRRVLAIEYLAEQGTTVERIPAIRATVDTGDVGTLVDSLIENLQREDLSPMDEAHGYARVMELGWKNKELAAAVGRSHAHVSKRLALLGLAPYVQKAVDKGWVDLGTAYALSQLKAEDQVTFFLDDEHQVVEPKTEADWEEIVDGDWLANSIDRLARQRATEADMARLTRKLKGLGYTVITTAGYGQWRFVKEHRAEDTPELPEGHAVLVFSTTHFREYEPVVPDADPEASTPTVEVEPIEGESDQDRVRRERAAAAEAAEAAETQRHKEAKAAANERRTNRLAVARELLVKPRKADVLELAWQQEFRRATNPSLYAHLHRAVVDILGVTPERSPRASDPDKTQVDYARTIAVYLAGDDFKAQAEVYLAFRAAGIIEQGMSDEALHAYAKGRDIDLG